MYRFFAYSLFLLSGIPDSAGSVPAAEVSIAGIAVGYSEADVVRTLGVPSNVIEESDYLNLHYIYPSVRVSFSDETVAGIHSESPTACTPSKLCPGDSFDRMRSLYGKPVVAERESGTFYEYYGADLYCWLQIPATGKNVSAITVACQP